jgi:hypothetical protein
VDTDPDPQHCLLGYSTSLLPTPSPLPAPIEQRLQVFSSKVFNNCDRTGPTKVLTCYLSIIAIFEKGIV